MQVTGDYILLRRRLTFRVQVVTVQLYAQLPQWTPTIFREGDLSFRRISIRLGIWLGLGDRDRLGLKFGEMKPNLRERDLVQSSIR